MGNAAKNGSPSRAIHHIVTGVALSGRWALSYSGKEVKVWDLMSGQERLTFTGHTNRVTGVALSALGTLQ